MGHYQDRLKQTEALPPAYLKNAADSCLELEIKKYPLQSLCYEAMGEALLSFRKEKVSTLQ